MRIGLVNHSVVLAEKTVEIAAIASACTKQMVRDVAPAWARMPIPVTGFRANEPLPEDVVPLVLFDDPDQAGVLGYHSEDPAGRVYGKVFVKPILDSGGTVTSGPNSVSATASHEACEIFGDATVNLWADMPDGVRETALELADAVEGDAYEIDGISLSNFLLPAWFDCFNARGPFDHMSKLKAPFTMSPGGYMILRKSGKVTQVFGESFAARKFPSKHFIGSRTMRRHAAVIAAMAGASIGE